MSDTQLQIVLSLIDNASSQLEEAQGAFANLGQAGAEAAAQITNSLNSAEEDVVAQAQSSLDAWNAAGDEIGTTFEEAVPTVESALQDLAAVNTSAAEQVLAQWQAEGQAMSDSLAADLAAAEGPAVAEATAVGEAAGTAAGEGFGGYFKKMIIAYALEQIGSFLSGGIDSAVAAAAKSGDQIATLSAQINQQKADIEVNEAALQKWTGTTVQVNAAHEKAAANIEAEKVKIQELTQQLAPLIQAQQGLPGQMTQIEDGILGWIGANKPLEDSLQTFMTTLGPILQWIAGALIAFTLLKVALSVLDGPLLILIGIGVAVALLTAIWQAFHTQITAFFSDLNAQTGIVDLFKESWQNVSDNFNNNLAPALANLWKALQPLEPYLQAMAVVIGATLLGAVVLLTDALTLAVDIFTGILTIGTKVATFFTDVLVGAINAVKNAIEAVITALNKVGGGAIANAIGAAFSGATSGVGQVVKAFASGGIVNSPTLALVGEAGPEAIIPLSAFNGGPSLAGGNIGGGAGSIVININGGSYLDQNGAQQIAAALATQINRQLKLRNYA